MSALSIFAPAKVNLFLAVTGRRPDGYHDLVSVVAPLDFGDTLWAEPAPTTSLECDNPELPCDETNLVRRAAQEFAAATGWRGGVKFYLEKRIPMGAGLGGGSSDGWAALRALNTLAGQPLSATALAVLSAEIGSDCPLFASGGPVIMRGRGERVSPLPEEAAARLGGQRILVFKPAFGVATVWAYSRLAADPSSYLPATQAEARVSGWIGEPGGAVEPLLFNSMERPVFAKFPALPLMLERLRADFGLAPRMSGSGSACFAFVPDDAPVEAIGAAIRRDWGDSAMVVTALLA